MKYVLMPTILLVLCAANIANADSVTLLGQGRSELVSNLLDRNLDAHIRLEKLAIQKQSQRNIEQMVVRDTSLGRRDPKHAALFTEYDRNFLVHASQEANRSLGGHWFHLVGLSSDTMRHAHAGRR